MAVMLTMMFSDESEGSVKNIICLVFKLHLLREQVFLAFIFI